MGLFGPSKEQKQARRGLTASIKQYRGMGYGGGFGDRQFLDPQAMQMMQQQAFGQAPSAAQQLMQAGLGQQQAQAYGLAAGAQGMNPALAMQQAQNAAGQAGLQAQAQFGAMRADEMARAQQAYLQAQMGQQGLNDAAAQAHNQMLNQMLQTRYGGEMGYKSTGEQMLAGMAPAAIGGAVSGLASGFGNWLFGGGK